MVDKMLKINFNNSAFHWSLELPEYKEVKNAFTLSHIASSLNIPLWLKSRSDFPPCSNCCSTIQTTPKVPHFLGVPDCVRNHLQLPVLWPAWFPGLRWWGWHERWSMVRKHRRQDPLVWVGRSAEHRVHRSHNTGTRLHHWVRHRTETINKLEC